MAEVLELLDQKFLKIMINVKGCKQRNPTCKEQMDNISRDIEL